jgi:hypothetical protein
MIRLELYTGSPTANSPYGMKNKEQARPTERHFLAGSVELRRGVNLVILHLKFSIINAQFSMFKEGKEY